MYREWNTFAKNFQSALIESKPPKGIQPPSLSFMSAYERINSVTYTLYKNEHRSSASSSVRQR